MVEFCQAYIPTVSDCKPWCHDEAFCLFKQCMQYFWIKGCRIYSNQVCHCEYFFRAQWLPAAAFAMHITHTIHITQLRHGSSPWCLDHGPYLLEREIYCIQIKLCCHLSVTTVMCFSAAQPMWWFWVITGRKAAKRGLYAVRLPGILVAHCIWQECHKKK